MTTGKQATERQEARALMQWASMHPICKYYLLHVPNGGSRNPIEAHNLRLEGVRAGVSDYLLAYPRGGYSGLWIELKRQGGRATRAQKEWLERMEGVGYRAQVAYGWDEAKSIIEDYLA